MKGDNMTEVNDPSLWWKQAVVYQVYPRSFKDSRGEGLGQIAGVTEKIGYLKELPETFKYYIQHNNCCN